MNKQPPPTILTLGEISEEELGSWLMKKTWFYCGRADDIGKSIVVI